jgi:two-component system sensor histidine kinase KdpD
LGRRALRLPVSLAGVALVTFVGFRLLPINATTQGFACLLLVLIIANLWGFFEASVASIASTLTFNFFFFEPIGTFTIDDPRNWVALFSFLVTSLIASRLSTEAKQRALDAVARQQDLERLYTFSRAILLIDNTEPFPKQLVQKLADIFELSAAVLYDRRTEEVYQAGPSGSTDLSVLRWPGNLDACLEPRFYCGYWRQKRNRIAGFVYLPGVRFAPIGEVVRGYHG